MNNNIIISILLFSFKLSVAKYVTININDSTYQGSVNNSVEYVFSYNKTDELNPSRVIVTSYDATQDFPVLVVARQQRQILSWQLPLLVDTRLGELKFNHTNRTLCPDDMTSVRAAQIPIQNAELIVSVATSSPVNVSFTLLIEPEISFHIEDNEMIETVISPSAPKIFFYRFSRLPVNDSWNIPDTVLLEVESDSNVCMLISIQNSTCPVYDLEHDIRFEGYWQTISKRGGMNVPRSKFPNGFFIILVSKSEDIDCTSVTDQVPGVLTYREKKVRLSLKPGITRQDYFNAILVTLGVAVAIHIFGWIVVCVCNKRHERVPFTMEALEAIFQVTTEIHEEPQTPTSIFDDDRLSNIDNDNSSMDETEYDTITEANSERQIFRTKGVLFVADLARKPTRILQKKSYLYLWHVITVAVFYGLPVVQLVFTYQKVLADTGNQDLCYYNFLCAHPLGVLSDFNHVLSNAGYIVLGILFIALVHRRERWYHSVDVLFDRLYGIPQHHGLFYAMGAALIMEGILSASYHVCPNHTNFQFDSSFMYVMAVLCMVKIYQNRHPDINATAYATFGVLAVAISLGMVGILAGNVYFWSFFTIAHIFTCLLLTVQIYYMGCWKCDRGMFMRVFRTFANDFRSGPVNIIKPVYKGRMALLVIGNVCNWALAIAGLLHHDRDFATYLLAIFMSNTLLYTLFYIVMKILHKEKIMWHAFTFIVLATFTWGAAMYFFINKSISWALTPAESRQYNQPCKLFNFYDPHDIWHFLSAAAMFFSFMILLTLDDDLTHTRRTKIHVF